jgi:hypothetical protein
MEKIFVLIALIFSTTVCSNIYAQGEAPPGAGDKNLRDNNIKSRSLDLERVDRDARKKDKSDEKSAANTSSAKTEDQLTAKYAEIKTDFEQIQLSQDAVIKAYQGTGKIDYAQIGKSALEINTSGTRLNSNLFPLIEVLDTEKVEKTENKKEKETTKQAKSVRDLIIDLDNAIGSFAASPMFQNLRTVNPKVSAKAKLDLEKIIELSAALNREIVKMANGGK